MARRRDEMLLFVPAASGLARRGFGGGFSSLPASATMEPFGSLGDERLEVGLKCHTEMQSLTGMEAIIAACACAGM